MTSWAEGSVKQNPTRRRTSAPWRTVSSPSTSTCPTEGSTSPLIRRASVDLPDPLPPMTAMRCSRRTRSVGARIVRSPTVTPAPSNLISATASQQLRERAVHLGRDDRGDGALDEVADPVGRVERRSLRPRDVEVDAHAHDAERVVDEDGGK